MSAGNSALAKKSEKCPLESCQESVPKNVRKALDQLEFVDNFATLLCDLLLGPEKSQHWSLGF